MSRSLNEVYCAYDVVVCTGGALNYAYDCEKQAVRQMLAVTRPGVLLAAAGKEVLADAAEDEKLWQLLLDTEARYACSPAALDCGLHLLYVTRKEAGNDPRLGPGVRLDALPPARVRVAGALPGTRNLEIAAVLTGVGLTPTQRFWGPTR